MLDRNGWTSICEPSDVKLDCADVLKGLFWICIIGAFIAADAMFGGAI